MSHKRWSKTVAANVVYKEFELDYEVTVEYDDTLAVPEVDVSIEATTSEPTKVEVDISGGILDAIDTWMTKHRNEYQDKDYLELVFNGNKLILTGNR